MLLHCFEPRQTRAALRTVRRRLEDICPRYTDLVGHIVHQMERPTLNLECIVAEKTAEIEAQTNYVNAFLSEYLPLYVLRHYICKL